MADAKITALTECTDPQSTDILPIVDDPAGTPVTKKVTVANLVPAASDTVAGKIELATQAEVDTGTDTTRAVTPATLASTNCKITAAPASDHAASGVTLTLTAAAAVNIGDLCYINSSGKAALVDADAIASCLGIVMATASISADAAGTFLLMGVVRDDTWNWTIGGAIYASTTGTTGNTLTQTAPSGASDVIEIVGVAITADVMIFLPNLVTVEHA